MKNHILTILAFTFFVSSAIHAQNRFHPWGLGISYNVSNMEGLFNQKFFTARNYSGGIKIHASRYISHSFNARLETTYGSIYYPKVEAYPRRTPSIFNQQNFFESSFLIEYKLNNNYIFKENAYVQPYLFIGLGTNTLNKDWNTFFPWGAGFKIKCTNWMAVNLETCFKVNIDNSYNYLQHNAGLIFSIGRAIEKTNNSIAFNKKVKSDLKEVNDVKPKDSDSDGIDDAIDECPFLAGISQFAGCPDSDGDGIPDSKDACPTEKGSIENNGCMPKIIDSDGDGVADKDDQCPYVKGIAFKFGCPELSKVTTTFIEDKTKNNAINNTLNSNVEIFYTTSISILNEDQKTILDDLASRLKSSSFSKLKINAYTSNIGSSESNIKLAMNRALTVLNYLASKGISQKQMGAYGYGPFNPKYNNANPTESIKNQRVEIIIE
jgi:outer membrane protein OmpA-like peptidoglycan-associated protein